MRNKFETCIARARLLVRGKTRPAHLPCRPLHVKDAPLHPLYLPLKEHCLTINNGNKIVLVLSCDCHNNSHHRVANLEVWS